MSQKEAQRLAVVQRVGSGELSQMQAAATLGISVRQVKRLCRQVRQQGPTGLISRKRGKPSNRRIGSEQRVHFMALVSRHYADFGPELAREYLARDHGFGYSTETRAVCRRREAGYGLAPRTKNGPALAGYGAVTMANALKSTVTKLPTQL